MVHLPDGPVTVAGAGLDATAARRSCLGEAVERYAGLLGRRPDVVAAPRDLAAAGTPSLSPSALGVASDPGPALPIAWVTGTDGRLVPAAAAAGDLRGSALPHDRYPQGSTGLAAGSTVAAATEAAAAEVVERDAVARAWAAGRRLHPVPSSLLPGSLLDAGHRDGLDAVCHLLSAGPAGAHGRAPVALVALRDRRRGYLGVGAAYRRDRTIALTKAWLEAVVSLAQAAELDDADRGPELSASAGLPPWRQDRRYATGGWSDVTDIGRHAQLLLDPAVAERTWWRLTGTTTAVPPHRTGAPARDLVRERFAEPVTVDLTPPDLAGGSGAGAVVRVLAPGARVVRPAGLTPEELPCPLV